MDDRYPTEVHCREQADGGTKLGIFQWRRNDAGEWVRGSCSACGIPHPSTGARIPPTATPARQRASRPRRKTATR